MPDFPVLIQKLTTHFIWIDVEAADQDEADRNAIEMADLGFFEFDEDVEVVDESDWEVNKQYRCLDCGVDTSGCGEYPLMIRDELWYQIVPGGEGMLCRADMERRLGRPLTQEDLIPLPKEPTVEGNDVGALPSRRQLTAEK